ncbi:MAG: heme biosynthesis HemY N-terminal domain-containing protein [Gammaproteobacteria bacterium]
MKLLLITLVLLLAAIYVGSVAMDDPGFIIIGYHGQVIRTSFIFFALFIILAGVILYFAVRFLSNLLSTPKKVSDWNNDRKELKAQKSLSKGFVALAEGNWQTAEKSLSHDAGTSDQLSYIHYLGAAEAAQNLGDIEKRDDYLQLAHSSAPQADVAVGITRAELQMQEGQSEMARFTLEELLSAHQNHPRILKLLSEIYVENREWNVLQPLMARIRKNHVLPSKGLDNLEKQIWTGLLEESTGDVSTMKQTWSTLPKKLKTDPDLLFTYLDKLVVSDLSSDAVPIIEKALKNNWDDRLVNLYGNAKGSNPAKQLEKAEKWLPDHSENHQLLSTLGKLSNKNDLWGKAKHYLETAIDFGAGPEVYRQLAETLEKMGETEEASNCCKKGLYLATEQSQEMALVKQK